MLSEGTQSAGADRLSALLLTERARRAQFPVRIVVAAIGCAFLALEIGVDGAALLFGAIILSQLLDSSLKHSIVGADRIRPVTRFELGLICLSNAQAAFVYGMVAVVAWFVPDPGFKIFAGFWVSGSMLHTMLHMHHDHYSFFSSFIPHAVVTVGLPLISLFFQHDVSLPTTGALLFATGLFVAHFATAFRTYNSKSEELRLAQRLAEERRQVAEAASEAKTKFLATLSHEIRTPMNGIIGMATSLDEIDLPEEARDQVRVLRQASDLLLVMLNDVLDVSKIEAGRLDLEDRPFNLHDTVNEVMALHSPQAAEKGVRLEADLSTTLPAYRRGDRHRLFQVLHNLVGNAIKFTEYGTVRVRLFEDDSGRVAIAVHDTGIGMTGAEVERVFNPFTQADSSTTRRYGGTGLGLTICKGLIEAMGGELTVSSQKNVGSTFVAHLPLPIEAADIASAAIRTECSSLVLQGQRILAVDDNPVNLKVLETLLKNEGCHIVSMASGEEALGVFSPDAFDLVLLDISMPGLDGPATLKRMRMMAAERPMPPALAVTAHAMPADVAAFLEGGFDGFVPKPLRKAELISAVDKAFQRRPAHDAVGGLVIS